MPAPFVHLDVPLAAAGAGATVALPHGTATQRAVDVRGPLAPPRRYTQVRLPAWLDPSGSS